MTSSAPAGWYRDPNDPTVEHWWDGVTYRQSRPVPGQVVGPVGYPAGTAFPQPVSPKSRTVAAILGFFLGAFGVDRFYLGNIGMGVAKLLLGWLTLGIWPLVDWIVILTGNAHDGNGLPVRRWE